MGLENMFYFFNNLAFLFRNACGSKYATYDLFLKSSGIEENKGNAIDKLISWILPLH
jgi:hypothetical protein